MTIRMVSIAATFFVLALSSAASAQVINGCIKSNGTLKIVSDPADCSARETPISWNQSGRALRVFDVDGTDLGLFMDDQDDLASQFGRHAFRVFLETSEASVLLEVASGNILVQFATLHFAEPACSGIGYVIVENRIGPSDLFATQADPIQYFLFEHGAPAQQFTQSSTFGSNGCEDVTEPSPPEIHGVPVNEVSLAELGLDAAPFPAPLYVGFAPQ